MSEVKDIVVPAASFVKAILKKLKKGFHVASQILLK